MLRLYRVAMTNSTQLESWYQSPKGAYVLNAQLALIRSLIASWKRRNHLVLNMGTGAGHTLEMLWECGFDVTGVDNHPDMIAQAQLRLHNKVTLHQHALEHLPYDDNAFDYVVLSTVLLTQRPFEPLFDEALRLASKGIVLFWKNSFSLHGQCNLPVHTHNLQKCRLQQYSPLQLWRYMHTHCPQLTWKFRSILLGPAYTWRHVPYFFAYNAITTPVPLGAFACLRIDKGTTLPLTGTPLLAQSQSLTSAYSPD